MSFLDSVAFQQTEERVKKYLMPQRVVLTNGSVKGAANLLNS